MRLLIAPLILVAILIQAPAPAQNNENQAAAEKIADAIGERFPDADIGVEYKGGQVWLKGEAGSLEQRKKISEQVFSIPGVRVTEINDEIQVVASRVPATAPPQTARQTAPALVNPPVPIPPTRAGNRQTPIVPTNARETAPPQAAPTQQPPQSMIGAVLAPYPQQHYAPAYGLKPGQQSAVPAPYAPAPYAVPAQAMPAQAMQAQAMQAQMMQQHAPQYTQQYMPYQQASQYQPAYGPPAQGAYHPEAYGPQGPLPGRYNQPHLPDYAWPTYANYPNYAQVTYPRAYSPKAWPYIGPFYPYPQVPPGWRKVTLEHHNGWWWLDFDDGTPSGPFSGLFRQPQQYTY